MASNLHPVFSAICESFQQSPAIVAKAQMDAYILLLRRHDWSYEYSDDHSVWRAGVAEKDELLGVAKLIDPAYEIWNQYAPDQWKRKAPAKTTLSPGQPEAPIIAQRIKELM